MTLRPANDIADEIMEAVHGQYWDVGRRGHDREPLFTLRDLISAALTAREREVRAECRALVGDPDDANRPTRGGIDMTARDKGTGLKTSAEERAKWLTAAEQIDREGRPNPNRYSPSPIDANKIARLLRDINRLLAQVVSETAAQVKAEEALARAIAGIDGSKP